MNLFVWSQTIHKLRMCTCAYIGMHTNVHMATSAHATNTYIHVEYILFWPHQSYKWLMVTSAVAKETHCSQTMTYGYI